MASSPTALAENTSHPGRYKPYSYHYHIESPPDDGDRVERFLTAFAAILRHSNYRFLLDMYAKTSSKCGRCAVACQVYQAFPCYRTTLLLDVYRRYYTTSGWLGSRLGGNGLLTEKKIDEMAELFYRCTACRRCKLECPMGIDHGRSQRNRDRAQGVGGISSGTVGRQNR